MNGFFLSVSCIGATFFFLSLLLLLMLDADASLKCICANEKEKLAFLFVSCFFFSISSLTLNLQYLHFSDSNGCTPPHTVSLSIDNGIALRRYHFTCSRIWFEGVL